MSFQRLVFILFAFVFIFSTVKQTWASCGCASCPIDTHSAEQTEKGMIRLDYSYEYIDQHTPRMGRDRASIGEIPGDHDEISTLNEVQRIGLDMGLSSRLSLQLVLPFVHREHQHFDNVEDALQTWNYNGLGDLSLITRYALVKPQDSRVPTLSSVVGIKLPTGSHHATNADGEEAEPGIQPGSGATSFILGAATLQTFSAPTLVGRYTEMPFFFSTTYQWNGKGNMNYKMGDTWLANLGTVYPILPKVGIMTQINLRVSDSDDKGDTDEQVERTGGTFVYVSPGLQLTMANNLWSFVYVQLPVYQRVNVIQLTSDYNLLGGISYKFNALE